MALEELLTSSGAYFEGALVVLAAALGGIFAHALRRPLVLGYVLAGLSLSFVVPHWPSLAAHRFETTAQIAVAVLLFWAGAEFPFRLIRQVRWEAIACGIVGILLSLALSLVVGQWLEWSTRQAFVLGIALSLSSTIILSNLTGNQEEHRSALVRIMIGATAVQELAIIPLAVVLPSLGEPALTLSPGHLILLAGKGVLILAGAILLGTRLIALVTHRFDVNRDHGLCIIAAVAGAFATAALAQAIGLFPSMSAFPAGLAASGFPGLRQSLGRLLPLRNASLAILLVTVAVLIDPYRILAHPLVLAVTLLVVFAGRAAVWGAAARATHYPFGSAALLGIGFSQLGEFSYILAQFARDEGIVDSNIYNGALFTLVVLTIPGSLLLNGFAPTTPPLNNEARSTSQ